MVRLSCSFNLLIIILKYTEKTIGELFKKADVSGDGKLQMNELRDIINTIGKRFADGDAPYEEVSIDDMKGT